MSAAAEELMYAAAVRIMVRTVALIFMTVFFEFSYVFFKQAAKIRIFLHKRNVRSSLKIFQKV